jgi:murein L,D-transpeptidase YcbB/YkuD
MWPLIVIAGALFLMTRERDRERSVADVLAPQVARDIAEHGTEYDTDLVSAFQESAGITTDGLYGEQTRAALIRHGVSAPPPAIFGWAA